MKTYKPPFILQHGLLQVIIAQYFTYKGRKMGSKVYVHLDGGDVITDYYPKDFDKDPKAPILFFYYGAFGYERAAYVQGFLKVMDQRKWRAIFINRRGFGIHTLKTPSLLEHDEL